jgi:hypothetical protein
MTRVADHGERVVKRILLRVDWHQVRDAVQLGLDKQSQLDHAVAIQAAIQVAIQLLVDWFQGSSGCQLLPQHHRLPPNSTILPLEAPEDGLTETRRRPAIQFSHVNAREETVSSSFRLASPDLAPPLRPIPFDL